MCTHGQSGTHMHTDPQAYCKQNGGGGAEQRDPNLWAAFQSLSPLHHCFQIRFGKCYLYLRGKKPTRARFPLIWSQLGVGLRNTGSMTLHLPLPCSLRGGHEVKNTPRPNSVAGCANPKLPQHPQSGWTAAPLLSHG